MKTETTSKNAAYTGLFAAIAASSCCIPPVIALIAGVGGGASALSWMEPFRPYLIAIAVVAIAYAWYMYLKPKKADDCCEVDAKPKWYQTKGFLIGVTLFAAVSIAFPYYSHVFYPDNKKEVVIVSESNVQTIDFDVKGMTCASCEEHVKHTVNKLEGIVSVEASFENEKAEVKFDSTKTSKEDIEKAINATGYKVVKQK
ncbi:mercuric transport protein MerTP [Winogradskyella sp.]|uniref:mercuric transport protein MerTP n=1 Tax=Winogradskyella sp. TaxID=1883156 RepID=UPI0025CD02F9|nr:mercuric transport protein MerTP [Winogradskyella sp.]MBT8245326.1 mercuric transport protein MerTP [Winogradskyella sp.]|tara:strand:+ start:4663 stop:5262 length:600 start_codon:yes stop_codon:yes gene_type:complete